MPATALSPTALPSGKSSVSLEIQTLFQERLKHVAGKDKASVEWKKLRDYFLHYQDEFPNVMSTFQALAELKDVPCTGLDWDEFNHRVKVDQAKDSTKSKQAKLAAIKVLWNSHMVTLWEKRGDSFMKLLYRCAKRWTWSEFVDILNLLVFLRHRQAVYSTEANPRQKDIITEDAGAIKQYELEVAARLSNDAAQTFCGHQITIASAETWKEEILKWTQSDTETLLLDGRPLKERKICRPAQYLLQYDENGLLQRRSERTKKPSMVACSTKSTSPSTSPPPTSNWGSTSPQELPPSPPSPSLSSSSTRLSTPPPPSLSSPSSSSPDNQQSTTSIPKTSSREDDIIASLAAAEAHASPDLQVSESLVQDDRDSSSQLGSASTRRFSSYSSGGSTIVVTPSPKMLKAFSPRLITPPVEMTSPGESLFEQSDNLPDGLVDVSTHTGEQMSSEVRSPGTAHEVVEADGDVWSVAPSAAELHRDAHPDARQDAAQGTSNNGDRLSSRATPRGIPGCAPQRHLDSADCDADHDARFHASHDGHRDDYHNADHNAQDTHQLNLLADAASRCMVLAEDEVTTSVHEISSVGHESEVAFDIPLRSASFSRTYSPPVVDSPSARLASSVSPSHWDLDSPSLTPDTATEGGMIAGPETPIHERMDDDWPMDEESLVSASLPSHSPRTPVEFGPEQAHSVDCADGIRPYTLPEVVRDIPQVYKLPNALSCVSGFRTNHISPLLRAPLQSRISSSLCDKLLRRGLFEPITADTGDRAQAVKLLSPIPHAPSTRIGHSSRPSDKVMQASQTKLLCEAAMSPLATARSGWMYGAQFASEGVDVHRFTEQTFRENAGVDKPVVMREAGFDASLFSMSTLMAKTEAVYCERNVQVQYLSKQASTTMTVAEFFNLVLTGAESVTPIDLGAKLHVPLPMLMYMPRLSLLDSALRKANVEGFPNVHSLVMTYIETDGAFRGPCVGTLGSVAIRMLSGQALVAFVPRATMQDQWDSFGRDGIDWQACGEQRVVSLEPGDVLVVPPWTPFASLALGDGASIQVPLWDEMDLDAVRQHTSWAAGHPQCASGVTLHQLPGLLRGLDDLLTGPGRRLHTPPGRAQLATMALRTQTHGDSGSSWRGAMSSESRPPKRMRVC